MAIEIQGTIAYEIKTGASKPLTDSQADILIDEYAKIGIRYKKGKWNEETCVYVRAQADDYKTFRVQHAIHWKEIHNRAGIDYLKSTGNSYEPERTSFIPDKDWMRIVEYIEKNYEEQNADNSFIKPMTENISNGDIENKQQEKYILSTSPQKKSGTTKFLVWSIFNTLFFFWLVFPIVAIVQSVKAKKATTLEKCKKHKKRVILFNFLTYLIFIIMIIVIYHSDGKTAMERKALYEESKKQGELIANDLQGEIKKLFGIDFVVPNGWSVSDAWSSREGKIVSVSFKSESKSTSKPSEFATMIFKATESISPNGNTVVNDGFIERIEQSHIANFGEKDYNKVSWYYERDIATVVHIDISYYGYKGEFKVLFGVMDVEKKE